MQDHRSQQSLPQTGRSYLASVRHEWEIDFITVLSFELSSRMNVLWIRIPVTLLSPPPCRKTILIQRTSREHSELPRHNNTILYRVT
uniref:Uncharacterized protein n=1 Tax=Setaria digitata TaxID=48799 RepID=A0A915PLE4_9BILA